MRPEADRPLALADLTSKCNLRSSTTWRSFATTVQLAPSSAPPTCLTHTSKPTVAWPGASSGATSRVAAYSIIEIIPGVESTGIGSVPPTSVSRSPSTRNSSVRSIPRESAIPARYRSRQATSSRSVERS